MSARGKLGYVKLALTLALGALLVVALLALAGVEMQVLHWQRFAHAPLPEGPPPPAEHLARVRDGKPLPDDDPAFLPSRVNSVTGRIPVEHLTQTGSCALSGCHPDISEQWSRSAHGLSSFNNPLYLASVEYTRAREGDGAVRWCGGCHDPALLFSGTLDGNPSVQTPGATAGVTCLTCHSTVGVRDLSGNASYILEVPDLRALGREGLAGTLTRRMLRLYPRAHRMGLSRELLAQPEFCSSCHRVSLTPDINHFHWMRGQDEYGPWSRGGVSGRVARSFYSPDEPKRCQDCHMPKVASQDAGHDQGQVRSHAFPGANTALPTLLEKPAQLAEVRALLSNSMRLDFFALRTLAADADPASETLHAPLGDPDVQASLETGARVSLDLVVRNLRVGHAFPSGVLDNKDVWLEVWATHALGQELWRQGGLVQRPPGPDPSGEASLQDALLPTSHRYGAILLDSAAQAIDKRNVLDARVALFARTLGPGQSEVVQFQFEVPPGLEGQTLTVEARLRYRKVAPAYLRWALAGRRNDGDPFPPPGSPNDPGRYTIDPNVALPELPIEQVAQASLKLSVRAPTQTLPRAEPPTPAPAPVSPQTGALSQETRARIERWQDYGNGFLTVEDAPRATRAFALLVARFPEALEGYVGQARAALRTGDASMAHAALLRAQGLISARGAAAPDAYSPASTARVAALLAQAELERGDFEAASRGLEALVQQFPQDASLHMDLAFALFQQDRTQDSLHALDRVLRIEPDHVSAWQLKARALGQLGQAASARQASQVFEALREALPVQGLRQRYLEQHPEQALEARGSHVHEVQWNIP